MICMFSGFVQSFRSGTVNDYDVDWYVDGVLARVHMCSDFAVQK